MKSKLTIAYMVVGLLILGAVAFIVLLLQGMNSPMLTMPVEVTSLPVEDTEEIASTPEISAAATPAETPFENTPTPAPTAEETPQPTAASTGSPSDIPTSGPADTGTNGNTSAGQSENETEPIDPFL